MTKRNWSYAMTLAAASALLPSGPVEAQTQDAYQIRADWLDPGVSADQAAQKLIIDELAQGYPIVDDRLDDYGLTEAAAQAIKEARNAGDFPGASMGEEPAQWWQRSESRLAATLEVRAQEQAERQRQIHREAWWFTLGMFALAGAGAYYDHRQKQPRPSGPPGGGGGKPTLVYRNPVQDQPEPLSQRPQMRFGNGP